MATAQLFRILENLPPETEPGLAQFLRLVTNGLSDHEQAFTKLHSSVTTVEQTVVEQAGSAGFQSPAQGDLDMNSHRISNLGNPAIPQDAVTLAYLNSVLGSSYAKLLQGTRATRFATGPFNYQAATIFFETDTNLFYEVQDAAGTVNTNGVLVTLTAGDTFEAYQVGAAITVNGQNTSVATYISRTQITTADDLGVHAGVAYSMPNGKWVYITGIWFTTWASRPTSVTIDDKDIGVLFYATDRNHLFRWQYDNPALYTFKWVVITGLMRDTFANRPTDLSAAPDGGSDDGFLFFATNRNHTWRWQQSTTVWIVQPQMSTYLSGVLSAITAGLTVNDVGYRYYATDFNREYTWQGAAWLDSPGQPNRGFVEGFVQTPDPATGWHLCDGTAGVTISKSDGTTTTLTVPDYTTESYLKFTKAAATVGPTAASGTTANESAHTHSVDPPATTSGVPSATVAVQAGAGTTVATDTHTHSTDVAPFTSGAGSAHSHAPGTVELARTVLQAYLRL